MRRHRSLPSLQSFVGKVLESHPGAVEGGGLFGVAHPPLNVVEAEEFALFGFGALGLDCF